MSLATVASVVGIGTALYGASQAGKGGSQASTGGGPGGGPPFYIPTGQGTADTQWQQLMTQLFGSASNTAGQLQPDMQAAYQRMRGIPTNEIERTGKEAGQYYQNLASSYDDAHNIMAQRGGEDQLSKQQLQGQGHDFMSQMLSLGMPLFGQGQDFMKSMQPLAAQMSGAGNDYYGKMMGAQNDLFGAGKAFQQSQMAPAAALRGAGDQLWNTALDPESKLAHRLQGDVTQGSRAATSARGIGMSGNAAGIENQAVDNFLMDWQDRQLGRQATGLSGMSGAYGQAGGLEQGGMQGLLNAYGAGGNLGAQGVNALFSGNQGAGQLNNMGLQGLLGLYGQGSSMLNSGLQGLSNMYSLGGQYGNAANNELGTSLAMGEKAPQMLQQSSMVPYLSQLFGPQMAMQFANSLGQGMSQNVYGPLQGAQSGYSPYLNFGQGATGNAFGASQANLSNMYSGLNGAAQQLPGAWQAIQNLWNPSTSYGVTGYGNPGGYTSSGWPEP